MLHSCNDFCISVGLLQYIWYIALMTKTHTFSFLCNCWKLRETDRPIRKVQTFLYLTDYWERSPFLKLHDSNLDNSGNRKPNGEIARQLSKCVFWFLYQFDNLVRRRVNLECLYHFLWQPEANQLPIFESDFEHFSSDIYHKFILHLTIYHKLQRLIVKDQNFSE